MTGSNVEEQLPRYSTISTLACVSLCMATTSRFRSHGVGAQEDAIEDVRMVLRQGACSGKRDVHENELLGRSLRWTEDGLEYEASDKHRQALLEGLGLSEESKKGNSAAVKPEEIGQEADEEMLEGVGLRRRGSGAWRRR